VDSSDRSRAKTFSFLNSTPFFLLYPVEGLFGPTRRTHLSPRTGISETVIPPHDPHSQQKRYSFTSQPSVGRLVVGSFMADHLSLVPLKVLCIEAGSLMSLSWTFFSFISSRFLGQSSSSGTPGRHPLRTPITDEYEYGRRYLGLIPLILAPLGNKTFFFAHSPLHFSGFSRLFFSF